MRFFLIGMLFLGLHVAYGGETQKHFPKEKLFLQASTIPWYLKKQSEISRGISSLGNSKQGLAPVPFLESPKFFIFNPLKKPFQKSSPVWIQIKERDGTSFENHPFFY